MLRTNLIKTAIGGLFTLLCFQSQAAGQALSKATISVPVYNLITDTLVAMTPTINGQRNDLMMKLVCDLARGDKSQPEVNDVLRDNKIDSAKIPQKGHQLSILVNGDKSSQQSACTAYIASSLFIPDDNSIFFDKPKATEAGAKAGTEKPTFNPQTFAQEMKLKMSIAQATSQLYAVVASNLENNKNQGWGDYQKSVAGLVESYAPGYLTSLKQIYDANQVVYTPVSITANRLDVIDSAGRELISTPTGLELKFHDVYWLGNGKIMGKEYFVDIKVIDTPAPAKPEKRAKPN